MDVVTVGLILLLGVLSIGLGLTHLIRPVSYGSTVPERILALILVVAGVVTVVFSVYLTHTYIL